MKALINGIAAIPGYEKGVLLFSLHSVYWVKEGSSSNFSKQIKFSTCQIATKNVLNHDI